MNKIEEIFASKYPGNFEEQNIYDCMKEFGKICFEAGTKNGITQLALKVFSDEGEEIYTYEDFLKEIENETGN